MPIFNVRLGVLGAEAPPSFSPRIIRRPALRALQALQRSLGDAPELFEGSSALFRHHVRSARIYGEYGVGASTVWVARNTDADIVAVDTSQIWIDHVRTQVARERLKVTWIDMGPVGDWGRPHGYARRHMFRAYRESIWRATSPDLILLDGRFRIACFLESLLRAKPDTRILFDDYAARPAYHIAAEFLAPVDSDGRQALFVVPEKLDRDRIANELIRFEYVMD